MCPKRHIYPGFSEGYPDDKMAPAVQSIFEEDRHDSGLDSVNLQSLHYQDTDIVSSVENAFNNMKIDSSLTIDDSGVYTSGQYSLCRTSETDYINTPCELRCISLDNTDCEDGSRREMIHMKVRMEEAVLFFKGDKDGDNKLHISIINGQETLSRLLINIAPEYACVNFSNCLRQTPLHLAVLTRQSNIVRRLICAGAIVLAQDKQGDTPLHIACRLGDTETVKHLLTPVHYEETLENIYSIPYQRLPQDFRVRNYEGQTCLHIAAGYGHHNIVQMLLEAGADINMGDDKSGRSILHLAADSGDTELVELLLSYRDLKVKKQDYAGLTPIQLAYGRNHMTVVKIICSLSGEYEGIHLSDPEISLEDEDLLDDSDM